MTPREAAEKRELEAALNYFAQRAFANAGEAAELKAALEETSKPTSFAGTATSEHSFAEGQSACTDVAEPEPELPADDPSRQAQSVNNYRDLWQSNGVFPTL